jgi:hypothetical protein
VKSPHHAATLALVGWYLMLLPKDGLTILALPRSAVQQSFHTAKECEQAREGFVNRYVFEAG